MLKNFTERQYFDATIIEAFDVQLTKFGTAIFKERKHFLERLISVFKKYYVLIVNIRKRNFLYYFLYISRLILYLRVLYM